VIVLLVASSLVVAQAAPARPSAPPQAVREQLARFLWSGFRDGREKLKRGAYHARGTRLDVSPERGRTTFAVEIFGAFDFDAGLRRFDRSEIQTDPKPGPPPDLTKPVVEVFDRLGGKWIMTPSKNFLWNDWPGMPQIAITKPGLLKVSAISPFDVRCLGLLNWNRYDIGDLEIDEILRSWAEMKVEEVIVEPNGFHRFSGTGGPNQAVRRTVWLDESKGFAPVRMEVYTKQPGGGGAYRTDPVFASALTWVKISDVWLPKTYHNEMSMGNGTIGETYDLTLEWDNVNQPLPQELFTAEGLSAPKGTYVTETRLGRPYVAVVIGNTFAPSPPPQPQSVKPARPRLSLYGVGAAAVALLLAAAAVYWRRGRLAA